MPISHSASCIEQTPKSYNSKPKATHMLPQQNISQQRYTHMSHHNTCAICNGFPRGTIMFEQNRNTPPKKPHPKGP